MSKMLSRIIDSFKETEPFFEFVPQYDGTSFRAHPVVPGTVQEEGDDAVTLLLKQCLENHEHFNMEEGCFSIDRDRLLNNALHMIKGSIVNFYEQNAALKKPRQSNTYKWLDRIDLTSGRLADNADGFILLFKYISTFASMDGRLFKITDPTDKVEEHVSNALALIELLREKYE